MMNSISLLLFHKSKKIALLDPSQFREKQCSNDSSPIRNGKTQLLWLEIKDHENGSKVPLTVTELVGLLHPHSSIRSCFLNGSRYGKAPGLICHPSNSWAGPTSSPVLQKRHNSSSGCSLWSVDIAGDRRAGSVCRTYLYYLYL